MMGALAGWLAGTAWQGALVGVTLLVASHATRSHGARTLLLTGGLAAFVMPGWVASPLSVWRLLPEGAAAAPVAGNGDSFVGTALFLLYACGVLHCMVRPVLAQRALTAEVRAGMCITTGPWHDALHEAARTLGMRRVPLLVAGAAGTAPRACGMVTPCILVPANVLDTLDPAARRALLTHELAHHARRDVLLNTMAAFVVALWWLHPVPRLLAARLRHTAEEACDDVVLHRAGTPAAAYADAILVAARACTRAAPLAAAFAGHPLSGRLRRIVTGERAPSGRRHVVAAAVVILLVLPGAARSSSARDDDGIRIVHRAVIRDVRTTTAAERRTIRSVRTTSSGAVPIPTPTTAD